VTDFSGRRFVAELPPVVPTAYNSPRGLRKSKAGRQQAGKDESMSDKARLTKRV
jgi:hypothetical protein